MMHIFHFKKRSKLTFLSQQTALLATTNRKAYASLCQLLNSLKAVAAMQNAWQPQPCENITLSLPKSRLAHADCMGHRQLWW